MRPRPAPAEYCTSTRGYLRRACGERLPYSTDVRYMSRAVYRRSRLRQRMPRTYHGVSPRREHEFDMDSPRAVDGAPRRRAPPPKQKRHIHPFEPVSRTAHARSRHPARCKDPLYRASEVRVGSGLTRSTASAPNIRYPSDVGVGRGSADAVERTYSRVDVVNISCIEPKA